MKKMVALLAGLLMMAATSAMALTLTNDNSTAEIANDGSWVNWSVNGINSMYQTNFFYQINGGTIYALNTSPYSYGYEVASTTKTFENTSKFAAVTYTGDQLTAELTYVLDGASPGQVASDMGLQFSLKNTTNLTQNVRVFQYVDLDISNTASDDYASKGPGQKINQWDEKAMVEMVYTPNVSAWQINGAVAPDLANLNNMITTTGQADYRWMLAWDWTLGAGLTAQLSEDYNMTPVPEPGTIVLLGAGLLGLGFFGRRRAQK